MLVMAAVPEHLTPVKELLQELLELENDVGNGYILAFSRYENNYRKENWTQVHIKDWVKYPRYSKTQRQTRYCA